MTADQYPSLKERFTKGGKSSISQEVFPPNPKAKIGRIEPG